MVAAGGITEEVIGDLSRIRSLQVIARSPAMRLKGASKSAVTTAHELGVDWVLEESARTSGDDLLFLAINATEHTGAIERTGFDAGPRQRQIVIQYSRLFTLRD